VRTFIAWIHTMTPQEREIATQIFVQFAARDVQKIENVGKSTADPLELAKLSFHLAAAFAAVDAKLSGVRDPNAAKFEFDAGDLAKWDK
jgi:hypothetical protein